MPLPQHARAAFISDHLRAQLAGAPLPEVEVDEDREGTSMQLREELTTLAKLLTNVVNTVRGQPGWPLEAVAAGLAEQGQQETKQQRKGNAVKAEALGAAMAIVDEQRPLSEGAALSTLSISRPMEERWGNREISLMAKTLERPSAYDSDLLDLLKTRQRLEDANGHGTYAHVIRDLDKSLAILGIITAILVYIEVSHHL